MAKKKSFNWTGITENVDGTFTASDGHAKRRLIKELHSQGSSVRSKKLDAGGYEVKVVGYRQVGPAPRVFQPSPARRSYSVPRARSYRGRPMRRYRRVSPRYIGARPGGSSQPWIGRGRFGAVTAQHVGGAAGRSLQQRIKARAERRIEEQKKREAFAIAKAEDQARFRAQQRAEEERFREQGRHATEQRRIDLEIQREKEGAARKQQMEEEARFRKQGEHETKQWEINREIQREKDLEAQRQRERDIRARHESERLKRAAMKPPASPGGFREGRAVSPVTARSQHIQKGSGWNEPRNVEAEQQKRREADIQKTHAAVEKARQEYIEGGG